MIVSTPAIISHEMLDQSFEAAFTKLKEHVVNRGNLEHVTVKRQLELIDELSAFDLGRFLLERRGINGYYTHYIVMHPRAGRITGLSARGLKLTPLEDFLLNKAPVVLATQQRFVHFQRAIQKEVKEGCAMASIPCGVMGDLLTLDYSNIEDFRLVGIDLDPESLVLAKQLANQRGLFAKAEVWEKDAWDLKSVEEFDLITSNGLTIYESSDERVMDFYSQLYTALKPNGTLVTSFLTFPPSPGFPCEWRLDKISKEDLLLQKILFSDILQVKWQSYRSSETVRRQLEKVGFKEIDIIYDDAHLFPTVVAKKRF